MANALGLIAKLSFLQNAASRVITGINPGIVCNMEKYLALSKIFYYTETENIQGDYLEFGVYTGSSFLHAMRCYKKSLNYLNTEEGICRFFGFDSFEGFGKLEGNDEHFFFQDANFITSLEFVKKRIRPFEKYFDIQLVKGFFSESLRPGANHFGITKAKVIFVDCDTYTAAKDVFLFCKDIVQEGTIIVLDDRLSYKGSLEAGETRAFREFIDYTHIKVRKFFTYGCGSGVYIVNELNK
jgi:hypothetical protein